MTQLKEKYDHKIVEGKWQAWWDKQASFNMDETSYAKRAYVLDMFPYPSAQGLHVGHPEGYTATDIYCRYLRLKGLNVLHPMGWDAFGLPAENYAIKTEVHPQELTLKNIENFRRQIKSLGFSYDWSREINTADPAYYKWTQWLFLQLYQKGLAYQKQAPVNWCPSCQTVLANEQVVTIRHGSSHPELDRRVPIRHGSLRGDSVEPGHPESDGGMGGECERCHSQVEQRKMKQWFFKITDYVEKLLKDLENLDWPENIKEMQKNWIGKSEGAIVRFPLISIDMSLRAERSHPFGRSRIVGQSLAINKIRDRYATIDIGACDDAEFGSDNVNNNFIEIFTTRLDTIFGATYLVLAPEHELLSKLKDGIKNWSEVEKYIKKAQKKTELERKIEDKEKTGIKLEGVEAINPANKEQIPIFIADYVLTSYGTGAIMAVPAHDERDWEFAHKFNLPIKQVIAPYFLTTEGKDAVRTDKSTVKRQTAYVLIKHHTDNKYLCLDWEKYNWHSGIIGGIKDGENAVDSAIREIQEETGYKHVKFVQNLGGEVHNHYYAEHKNENRYAVGYGMLFKLVDDNKDETVVEHTKNHKVVWIEDVRMGEWLNLPVFNYMWQIMSSGKECFVGYGITVNSGKFNGLDSETAIKKIAKKIDAKLTTQYRLRDWLISRQRYWGAPIPIIYCDPPAGGCGTVPVPEKDLPVELPDDVDFRPHGESPLMRSKSFHNIKCPECGKPARRESDTMDTFVDSSWYFLRYCDPNNNKIAFDAKKVVKWCPVNLYVGGAEHAVMHLLYARFITKVLYDLKLVNFQEPFLKLINQGLILGEDGQKMSKSRGNVVNPDEIVAKYGADTFRLYEMFMGPLEDAKPWNTASIIGMRRFLERICQAVAEIIMGINQGKIKQANHQSKTIHATVKKVSDDIESFRFNTAISALMEYLNKKDFVIKNNVDIEAIKKFLILLYPFVPHIAAELWQGLEAKKMIWEQAWPNYDKNQLKREVMTIAVQVNGKLRGNIECEHDVAEKKVATLAENSTNAAKYLAGKKIIRTIYVPGKLINFVVR
ncbi:MAG: class I tRNA ligase family protein [Patescibacteria group bacterium]